MERKAEEKQEHRHGSRSYYSVQFTTEMYELEEATPSDYGTLEKGHRVLKGHYLNRAPTPGWYTPNPEGPFLFPCELVLHASFAMDTAQLPPRGASKQQRDAVGKGAVVLSEADHAAAVEELKQRYGGE